MSAADYYQPHVTIDGRRLSETRGLNGLSPVADIAIRWGGKDWWENIDPSRLSLVLLDPYGELLGLKRGVEVEITIDPDDRSMFRGILDASRATYTKVQSKHGKVVPVWRVEVEAFDPLAQLAGDRKHGPYYFARNGQVNMLHWGRSSIIERHLDIRARSAAPIVFKYADWMQYIDETLGPQGDLAVMPYTLQQNVSVLTVLRQTARIEHPLNRPYYDHERGEIRLLKPATADTLPTRNAAPQVVGGQVVLTRQGISTVPPVEIDAALLTADGGSITLDLKEYNNVNRCVLKSQYVVIRPADPDAGIYGTHYEARELTNPVTLTAGLGDGSTVELETDMIFTANPNIPAPVYAGISTLMLATDGWRQVPPFSFSVRKHSPLPPVLASLFRAHPAHNLATDVINAHVLVNTPLQWGGSVPSFSVVGGQLRYTQQKGWQVTCIPASIPTRPAPGLKLGDLTITAPISSIAARYTVGDFQIL